MQRIKCTWKKDMLFEAKDDLGHSVLMDLGEEAGGSNLGFRPMPMLLVGLGGCMGVDVKIILNKMKIDVSSMEMDIFGEMDVSKSPKTYKSITLSFYFKGMDLEQEKLEKAIELAKVKYCNVSAILGQTCELSFEAKIVEE